MKVGIYNATPGSLGGAVISTAVLAEALGEQHEVEILHHAHSLTLEEIAEFSGTTLNKVRLRNVESMKNLADSESPASRYQKNRAWGIALTQSYDLFVTLTQTLPPLCAAPKGILRVLFPGRPLPHFRSQLWKEHLDSYQLKTANSYYTKAWAKRWWDIDCHVVYPPVNTEFRIVEKANTILSVGRFATKGVLKKQLEMVTAFREMKEEGLPGWNYFSVGVVDSPDYFETVSLAGSECQAEALANVKSARLKELYEEAKIFWHAAGYGDDNEPQPVRAEHFGISTAEAMAAGCVPIAINKGGQRELIRQGVDGFLWNTLEELKDYTLLVAHDEHLRVKMSEAARSRARLFSRERYADTHLQFLRSQFGRTLDPSSTNTSLWKKLLGRPSW